MLHLRSKTYAPCSSFCSATAFVARAKLRTGACSTDKSIDSRPSRDGSSASALMSSAEDTLPSIIPALISNCSLALAKSLMILAGATTSSLEKAIAFGPVKNSLIPSNPSCSAERRVSEFL